MRGSVRKAGFILMITLTMKTSWAGVLEEIRTYYEKVTEVKTGPITFVDDNYFDIPEGKELIQVMVMRHGKPLLKKKNAYSWKEARQYINEYDTVSVQSFETDSVCVADGVNGIYCSNLQRSINTAQYVGNDSVNLISDEKFREFEREILPIPGIKMPLKFWLITARIPWFFGFGKIEGLRGARKRSKEVARFLDVKAKNEKRVLLVAHGFLNRFLKKRMKKEGWEQVRDGGHDYLAVSVYAKLVDKQ